jgi:hypothetical protein
LEKIIAITVVDFDSYVLKTTPMETLKKPARGGSWRSGKVFSEVMSRDWKTNIESYIGLRLICIKTKQNDRE